MALRKLVAQFPVVRLPLIAFFFVNKIAPSSCYHFCSLLLHCLTVSLANAGSSGQLVCHSASNCLCHFLSPNGLGTSVHTKNKLITIFHNFSNQSTTSSFQYAPRLSLILMTFDSIFLYTATVTKQTTNKSHYICKFHAIGKLTCIHYTIFAHGVIIVHFTVIYYNRQHVSTASSHLQRVPF